MGRVLLCLPHFSFNSGVATVVRAQSAMLRAMGHRVSVCCTSSAAGLEVEETGAAPAPALAEPSVFNVYAEPDFKAVIRLERPDLIIAHAMPFYVWLSREAALRRRAILWDHGEPPPELFPEEREERAKIERTRLEALGRLDREGRAVAISRFIKRADALERAPVVDNGVEAWTEVVRERRRERFAQGALGERGERKPGGPGGPSVLLLQRIGRMEALYKRYDQVFDLEAALAERLADFRLVCAGALSGSPPTGSERLSYVVNFTPLQKRRMFLDNAFFVSFSEWEGFNLPLVEAQAVGMVSFAKPVAAHLETALAHFERIDALADAIVALSESPERYRARAAESITHAARFSWEGMREYLSQATEAAT